MINEFVEFNNNTATRMRELKQRTGKKMVGWTCNYTPIEFILAAGMIPVRIFSRPEPINLADSYLQNFICNVSRSYLEQLLRGDLDYLDSMATANVCDPLLFTHEITKLTKSCKQCHLIQMPPEVVSPVSKIWWEGDAKTFIKSLEELSGNEITSAGMKEAIELMNETRGLIQRLYRLRRGKRPPLSGAQVLQVVLAGMTAVTPEYNSRLKYLLDNLPEGDGALEEKIRLMVVGATVDFSEMELLEEFEKSGGIFVADETCTGSRWAYRDIPADAEPLQGIMDRYHYAGFCAARHPSDTRYATMKRMAEEYNVQGVVVIMEKFCDPFSLAVPDTEKMFKEMNIPCLVIESTEASTIGQVKTRVQGFFEIIKGV